MLTIRRLAIQNYRSILKADLKLGNITAIVGPSDTGKSNLVRALRDWAFNASGQSMISEGKTICRVAATIEDNFKVVLEKTNKDKGKSRSRYVTKDALTDEVNLYERTGRKIPPEIAEKTKIKTLEIDDISLRIQFSSQAEPWFLLSSPPWSPAKVSKIIGTISGVDSLIVASVRLRKRKIANNREANYLIKENQDNRKQLSELAHVDECDELLNEAEELLKAIEDNERTLIEATRILGSMRDDRKNLEGALGFVEEAERDFEWLEAIDFWGSCDSYSKASSVVDSISKLISKKKRSQEKAEEAKENIDLEIEKLKELDHEGGVLCPLCGESAHEGCLQNLIDNSFGTE